MTKIVLVDDHEVLTDGLTVLLRDRGFEVVGTAATAAAALDVVLRERPDVAVIDIELPDDDGMRLTRRLREHMPGLEVVLHTGQADGTWVSDAMTCGARGLALKSGSVIELSAAIERVARGQSYVDPRLDAIIAGRSGRAGRMILTPREREVLALTALGYTADGVALELTLSVETVRTHIRNAVRRLSARNRVHAVAIALTTGEIALPED